MQLLRKLAFPLSLLYALVVFLRNRFYDYGWLPSRSFGTAVVCVGNLSVGGTGKTPMTEWIISRLSTSKKLVVLSRGYRRKSRGFRIVNPDSSVAESGDEPLQMAIKFPEITVAVDSNRTRGIHCIEQEYAPDVVLLDDAFQHRKVKPKLSILLTAYGKLYSDDWYLPTGDLRDHRREARRASAIVVTKCPADMSDSEKSQIIAQLKPRRGQMVLFASLVYNQELQGQKGVLSLDDLLGKHFTLVTGIANPGPLVDYLKGRQMHFEHRSYPDHHVFTKKEITELEACAVVITTEKDFMRLKDTLPNSYYLEVRHKFLGSDEKRLLALLAGL
ncbi:MAG: tetraacyldisaccharide 4'-kinase [Flavobacteriaceae bacterium]|nr:tetraacyldisaccharide 4'-kinase [Eudoraea sp.]NNJ39007.1 tetraacyldisaccharide 4'-kinase [Flavobacteriaceae bacterium]